jgi:hypothetical protein
VICKIRQTEEMDMSEDTLTHEAAEKLYSEIMSGVFDLILALGASIDDPRISEIYKAIDLSARDIHSYATSPPSR